jgi:D-3-phosphoglycerate dehydrogenase
MARARRPWVAVTATDDFPVALAPVREALHGIAPVRVVALPFSPLAAEAEARHAAELQGAHGILLRPGYITASLLDRLPDLRVVAVHGAGVDQVDVAACTARGVQVTNAPGANADAVAELTLGLMLSLARRIPESAARVGRERVWGEARHTGSELRGKTLGLLGIGQIGRRVAAFANAFGMRVLAHDPGVPAAEVSARGARPASLERLLAAADYISLHLPALPATRHLIDERALGLMKPGAYLVNAARGPLVDEAALVRALQRGRLAGAALDVLDGEPPDRDSAIFSAPNVILTPHMGGSTHECLATIARTAATDIARVLGGRLPRFRVNRPARRLTRPR